MVPLSAAVIKAFVHFLAMTLQGILETPENPDAPAPTTVCTATSYVETLYSVLSQDGLVIVDKDIRTQVCNYLALDELHRHVSLSTKKHEKHYTSMKDFQRLINAYYANMQYFCMNHMQVQMSALTLLLAISTESIGAVIESNCYHGLNAALAWKNIAMMITPNPKTPLRPDVALQITVSLLKGGRDIQSYFKTFLIFPEYGPDWAHCPILPLIVLGVLDQVWKLIGSMEDIFSPRITPTIKHTLRIHLNKCKTLVIRAEMRSKEVGWSISPTEAMDYGMACQHL
ncbi:hypothetical protein J3R82DRAFT_1865 [Butyriboletus roseoflavus]|nr:hypothetical protein J3R82DRAFT_1865 [Butyriboletus roseoflavus]